MEHILLGKSVVSKIKVDLAEKVQEMKENLIIPKLVIMRIGSNPSDISYQNSAIKFCNSIGIEVQVKEFEGSVKNDEFINEFDKVNRDKCIDGILILRPIPMHIDMEYVKKNIDQRKDVDGIGYANMAKLYAGDLENLQVPCTAEAVINMLDFYNIDISGKLVTVIGRSLVIGKPVAMLLLNKNATINICHSKTTKLAEICKKSDIIVTCTGNAKFVKESFITQKSIVIDVGINIDDDGEICGDADFENIENIVTAITPVPRGIGSITNAVLAKHIVESTQKRV